ncbi:hypothetical protein J7E50_05355 [Pedobacter sp. ISL-68]|uniref:DUF5077 domain-containing protein n=1 Tax=unclassified Pedobacter TaxID=2628915 RepID=UPI001BE920E0|nr:MULTISPECIES: hypothetical protein [unclassified Pedobacter]MBT2563743.1 hypothetical protein [Pedobacter sp. ISL-64]MBT2589635.1 hypothetical protein [Pedobacter sp. ISL-68]
MKKSIFLVTPVILFMVVSLVPCKKTVLNSQPEPLRSRALVTTPTGGGSLNVPLGGNAYVTTGVTGGAEAITSAGITGWTNANSIFSAYFRLYWI